MSDGLPWHRIQFAFSITFHYLFPQLTMGLALLIVMFKSLALRLRDESYNEVARFWGRIFALNFAMGVVTGIPMEFQFGTNWAEFSRFSGEVIGQALALEGVFAFFLESTFLGLFLFGERRFGPRRHLAAAVALALGSWLSGYFIGVGRHIQGEEDVLGQQHRDGYLGRTPQRLAPDRQERSLARHDAQVALGVRDPGDQVGDGHAPDDRQEHPAAVDPGDARVAIAELEHRLEVEPRILVCVGEPTAELGVKEGQ